VTSATESRRISISQQIVYKQFDRNLLRNLLLYRKFVFNSARSRRSRTGLSFDSTTFSKLLTASVCALLD
jgi:hypothetical protein